MKLNSGGTALPGCARDPARAQQFGELTQDFIGQSTSCASGREMCVQGVEQEVRVSCIFKTCNWAWATGPPARGLQLALAVLV